MNQVFEVQFIDWEGTEQARQFPTYEEAEEFKTNILLENVVLSEENIEINIVYKND